MDRTPPLDPDLLLEHAGFLKALARGLLHDEQEAEDVAQEALLAAWRRPPAPGAGGLRGWLAAVARNRAVSRVRSRARRAARERAAEPRDPQRGDVGDALGRLELQRLVVEQVLALEEPYRSAVVHRFFYGRGLAEIAQLLGTPTATARTHVRRGLEILRGRLDRAHDGDRRAWMLGVAALLELGPRPLAVPRPLTLPLGAAAVVLLGGTVALLVLNRGRDPAPAPARRPSETLASTDREPSEGAPVVAPPAAAAPSSLPPAVPASDPWDGPLAGAEPVALPPGFVEVPAGVVHPGASRDDIAERAVEPRLWAALRYDLWPDATLAVELPRFYIQRYEITNAQWKLYLDREFRETHVTGESETLRSIADSHIRFRDRGVEDEWRAIYCLNWEKVYAALQKADGWKDSWTPANPGDDPGRGDDLGAVILPAGIELHFYRHRTPRHWYGWCSLSHLNTAREYCDVDKSPAEAFVVPEGEMFADARLRATDFAACPIRDVSPNELLTFAEWAGCMLPSEYEWERAARGDRLNSQQFTGDGRWDHNTEPGIVSSQDNPAALPGPLPVDAGAVRKSDSPFGLRHMLGNVWELTRTFWDFHPGAESVVPPPEHGLFNYALVAKGASYGDSRRLVAISTRTGYFGPSTALDIQFNNRVDTVGGRLVRHPTAGEDLLRHSLLRLTYDRGRGRWASPPPHEFDLGHTAGLVSLHLVASDSPYVFARARARGIAFAPVHRTGLGPAVRGVHVLGVLRSDVPLRARVRSEGWADGEVGPGEWLVIHWRGYLGLAGRGPALPPEAVLSPDLLEPGYPGAERPEPARLAPGPDRDTLRLRVWIERDPGRVGARTVPDEEDSPLWALCETLPEGWPGRPETSEWWELRVTLRVVPGGLRAFGER